METKNAIDTLLDEAKEKAGFKADNELAIAIGVSRQTINHYRKGRSAPDDYVKSKIADLTGRSLQEIIARIELENEPNEEKRRYWENFYKRLGGVAASIVGAVTLIVTPTPAEAASILKALYDICILCKMRKWFKSVKKAFLAFGSFQISPSRHYSPG